MAYEAATMEAEQSHTPPPVDHKGGFQEKQSFDEVDADLGNLIYDREDVEPELHLRTYIALAAMFLLNFVIIIGLNGPPAVLTFIAADLNGTNNESWIVNCPSLVTAVIGPAISYASDVFQARKAILLGASVIAFIGAAIAPGSGTIYRLIGAQIMLGFGQAVTSLAYSVPSEILPRKWRPMAQAFVNVAASLASCSGPLIIGALTRGSLHRGWRNFYWIQMGLWGLTGLGILVGYRPPPRHTRLDHLTLGQKLGRLDLPGTALLTSGLTLFLAGLNLRSAGHSHDSATVLAPLIIGLVIMLLFVLYEWKGTSTGILHHGLFSGTEGRGRNFAICIGLVAVEGILLISYVVYYPILTVTLFETDPFLQAARGQSFWLAFGIGTVIYGAISTRLRILREPLMVGYVILTAGIICLATVQPSNNTAAIAYAGLAGLGFGAPLILIISIVQLSTPHHLIATATAVIISSRAIFGVIFTAIFFVAVNPRFGSYIPSYVSAAALQAGLPPSSLGPFIGAIAGNNEAALPRIPGVTPAIIGAAVVALKQAFADAIRIVYEIAAPFGAAAVIGCFFLTNLRKTMNYRVDAPVEDLRAKHGPKIVTP